VEAAWGVAEEGYFGVGMKSLILSQRHHLSSANKQGENLMPVKVF